MPPAWWLRSYRTEWLKWDVVAGVTLAAYAIPVSLAYASLAGLQRDLERRGIQLRLAEARAQVRDLMRAEGMEERVGYSGRHLALDQVIAEFEGPLRKYGAWFYPRLFWEAGAIGQVLYLEAEACGIRSTGIGCFFDDPMHRVLGLTGCRFQDLYHFTIGGPVEDKRLTTLPAYSSTQNDVKESGQGRFDLP